MRSIERHSRWLGILGLSLLTLLYIVAYSSKSIATYTSGNSLFDLAVFSQAFWNTTEGSLFYSSLEGDMSHFGRHFSPVFFVLLPLYALHRTPETLLVLQSIALGLAAVPLYLFALKRLKSTVVALAFAALYLSNPAIHDINIVNEFHEIAFAVPLLMLAFYAAETDRWSLYGIAVLGSLMVKEEIALTVAALGVYVLFFKNRWAGIATISAGATWFILVVEWVMPWFRGPRGPVPFPGYDYLGNGIFGIARGILTKPAEIWDVVTINQKQQYLKWLFMPVAFVSLLAPEILMIAVPGILLILVSTFPPTFVIFERYVAPVMPFVYLAAVVGVQRLHRILNRLASSHIVRRRTDQLGVTGYIRSATMLLIMLVIFSGAVYSQRELQKYPTQIIADGTPHPHGEIAIRYASELPEDAIVVIEDHRWLAHASNRHDLYFLSASSPSPDYLIIDTVMAPTTNVPQEERQQALSALFQEGDLIALRCEDGVTLFANADAIARDATFLEQFDDWECDADTAFSQPHSVARQSNRRNSE